METVVSWQEVAAYRIACAGKQFDESGKDKFLEVYNHHLNYPKDATLFLLKSWNRAAIWLLSQDERPRRWSKQTLPLGSLRLRYGGAHWSVEAMSDNVKEAMKSKRVTVLMERFLPGVPVNTFMRTLIVEEHKGSFWIGDGYHRSVAMWLNGAREVECYVGASA